MSAAKYFDPVQHGELEITPDSLTEEQMMDFHNGAALVQNLLHHQREMTNLHAVHGFDPEDL